MTEETLASTADLSDADRMWQARSRADIVQDAFIAYREPLRRYISRSVDSDDDTADLLHDTYIRIMQVNYLPSVRNLRAFLYRAATNLIKDYRRKGRARSAITAILDDDIEIAAETPCAERALSAQQHVAIIERTLAQMPDKWREALVLHRFHDLTYPEIAARLEISVRSVQNYIGLAMDRISKSLGNEL